MKLNKKQRKAIKLAIDPTVKTLFITGAGGTGKTEIIKEITQYYDHKDLILLAPTHSAAQLIGGETIHGFFKIAMQLDMEADREEDALSCNLGSAELANAEGKVVLIDEISMVGKKMLDSIIEHLPVRKLILVGDLEQLEPVKERAVAWGDHCTHEVNLEENYRTSNPKILKAINAFRDTKSDSILMQVPTVGHFSDIQDIQDTTFIAHRNSTLSRMQEGLIGYSGAKVGDELISFGTSTDHTVITKNRRTKEEEVSPYFVNGDTLRVTKSPTQTYSSGLYAVEVVNTAYTNDPIDNNQKFPKRVEVIVGSYDDYKKELQLLYAKAQGFGKQMKKKYDPQDRFRKVASLKTHFNGAETATWNKVWREYLGFKARPYARNAQFTTCYKAQGRSYSKVVAHWDDLNSDDLKYVAISRAREGLTLITSTLSMH